MVEREFRAVIDVKAITMRRDAIFTAILVGLPPSESNGISRTCREMMLYNHLRYACAMPEVLEVCCPGNGRRLELVGDPHEEIPSEQTEASASCRRRHGPDEQNDHRCR